MNTTRLLNLVILIFVLVISKYTKPIDRRSVVLVVVAAQQAQAMAPLIGFLIEWVVGEGFVYTATAALGGIGFGIGYDTKTGNYHQQTQTDRVHAFAQQYCKDYPEKCKDNHSEATDPSRLPPGYGDGWRKAKGRDGYIDPDGNRWSWDKGHADHWDVEDKRGKAIKEVSPEGDQIWPNGRKNKNKDRK